LKTGNFEFTHRWIRAYGTTFKTIQQKEILLEETRELDDKLIVWSSREIRFPGYWFVEIRASKDQKLCLEKQEAQTRLCEFGLHVR